MGSAAGRVGVNVSEFSCLGEAATQEASCTSEGVPVCARVCIASVYLLECMVLMHFVCGLLCVRPWQRAAGIYTADIQHTHTRVYAHTHTSTPRTSSRCLRYFIRARHGWCPGPTQRAHSGVRTFTRRQPTSSPPDWPSPPPALLCYQRLSEEEQLLCT